jgi:hypothetical protein
VLHTFNSNTPDELFGNHISGAGDVDGDGYADVIVGSPGKEGESKVLERRAQGSLDAYFPAILPVTPSTLTSWVRPSAEATLIS